MDEPVFFTENKSIGLINLNRPAALNALDLDMIQRIQDKLLDWENDDRIRAVVIKAQPGKAFCAGGDVRCLFKWRDNPEAQLAFFWHEYRLNAFIHAYSKPYIALMDGITMGGGIGVGLHGSHRVASSRFSCAMPETAIGFFPDVGASFLLNQTNPALGLYLGLTGTSLQASQALAAGLVDYQIAATHFETVIDRLSNADWSADPQTTVDRILMSLAENKPVAVEILAAVETFFSAASRQAVFEGLAAAETVFSSTTLTQLSQRSALSLRITFEQFARAKGLSCQDCLRMDYLLAVHFMQRSDFYEGVRALLIDKDKAPAFCYPTVEAVPESVVASYFEAVPAPLVFIR